MLVIKVSLKETFQITKSYLITLCSTDSTLTNILIFKFSLSSRDTKCYWEQYILSKWAHTPVDTVFI